MTLTLLHTAQVHVARFDALRDRIAPGAVLKHIVAPDWLEDARRNGITPALTDRLRDAIGGADGPVICTCTTLGDTAERLGAIRIDRPLMRQAARIGGRVAMAYALSSTLDPSRALFAAEAGRDPDLMIDLTAHWPLFEGGDEHGFERAIADGIRQAIAGQQIDAVVLAQASMAGTADHLGDLGIPVLASPELALRYGLGIGTTG
jgi:hypothetical protein